MFLRETEKDRGQTGRRGRRRGGGEGGRREKNLSIGNASSDPSESQC